MRLGSHVFFQQDFPHNAIKMIDAFPETLILSRIVPDYHQRASLQVGGWPHSPQERHGKSGKPAEILSSGAHFSRMTALPG